MSNDYDTDNNKVVGFTKEAETIMDQLIHGSKEREIVLITDMGELGKTTLARRVYNEKIVVNYFDNRAWCTVSQEYDCKDLLHKIYSQVCGSEIENGSVAEKLHRSLMWKRYLIVLDDIWNVEALEELSRVFPSSNHGSRIVLTSRERNVVYDGPKIYNGLWVANKFENLSVLDLEFIDVHKSFLSKVNTLIHLRYLALNLLGRGFVSPLALGNLKCLLMLRLRSVTKYLHLPRFFLYMRSLRHMFIFHDCDLCMKESTLGIEAIPTSEFLQTLYLLLPPSTRDEHLLRKLPNLKELGCSVSRQCPFPEIDSLHHLKSLMLASSRDGYVHLNDLKLNKFPSSILKINLSRITLSSSAISIIAQLSNLEALILHRCKFEGLEWNVEEDTQFYKLKYLEFYGVGIRIWNITSAESFPCLETLILIKCTRLQKVPESLADILTLTLISVCGCNDIVPSSVTRIQEDAQGMGNEQLIIQFSYSLDDKTSSAGVSQLPKNVVDETKLDINVISQQVFVQSVPQSHHQPPPPLSAVQTPCSQPNSSAEFDSAELGGDGGWGAAGSGSGDEPARTLKRPRLVWTPQLHKRFVDAVAHMGIKNAVPRTIMQMMGVDGLTRENVASHLQKYRLYLKRMQGLSNSGGSGGGNNSAAGVDPMDHLFTSSPVPAPFLHPVRPNSDHFVPFVPVSTMLHHHQMAAVVGHHPQLQQQYRRFVSPPKGQFEHPYLSRQSQQRVQRMGTPVHNSSPAVVPSYVDDVESANGRKVLTLFPTGDD